jgi:hypothetical protein
MSAWAAKLARLASAEGEEDVDILRHHRAHVLLAEAAAILRAGSSASFRARAAEKIANVFSDVTILKFFGGEYFLARNSSSFAADAADVGEAAATFAKYLDVISLMRVAEYRGEGGQRRLADVIMALLEEIRAGPEAVDESLRRLGTTLTAAQLELFSLECLVDKALPGDPVYPQRITFARRQAFPCAACPRGTAGSGAAPLRFGLFFRVLFHT